jgi:hypothetical protein
MGLMTAAKAAILAELEPVGRLLFVLLRIVVTAFAIVAGQNYHDAIFFFRHNLTKNKK